MITPQLKARIKKIKFILLDIDGILTDGRIVYDNKGNELKFFDVQDGFGVILLKRVGIDAGIMTAKSSRIVKRRAKDLKVKYLYMNCFYKLEAFEELLKKSNLNSEEICYMGDDLIDVPVLKRVGFAVSVPNAIDEAKEAAHYVTKRHGGRGAVREVCDLILKTQDKWHNIIPRYSR